jgi:hypothetical protein
MHLRTDSPTFSADPSHSYLTIRKKWGHSIFASLTGLCLCARPLLFSPCSIVGMAWRFPSVRSPSQILKPSLTLFSL